MLFLQTNRSLLGTVNSNEVSRKAEEIMTLSISDHYPDIIDRAGWRSDNALDSHLGGARFVSRPEHGIILIDVLRGIPQSSITPQPFRFTFSRINQPAPVQILRKP
jgi:hypothetical protein